MYAQVLSGLSYLASLQHSVIHYDLKPANIMLTTRNEVRLTHVGLAAEYTLCVYIVCIDRQTDRQTDRQIDR